MPTAWIDNEKPSSALLSFVVTLLLALLYSAELYPTHLRAIGTGFGSAWLMAGSSIGPILIGWTVSSFGIQ